MSDEDERQSHRGFALPDETVVNIVAFVAAQCPRDLVSLRCTCRRLARIARDDIVWQTVFAYKAGAPMDTPAHLLRPKAWRGEPWHVSVRRMSRPFAVTDVHVYRNDSTQTIGSSWTAPGKRNRLISSPLPTPSALAWTAMSSAMAAPTRTHVWLATLTPEPDTNGPPQWRRRRRRRLFKPLCVIHARTRDGLAVKPHMPWWWWHAVVQSSPSVSDSDKCATIVLVVATASSPHDLDIPACVARSLSGPVPDGACHHVCPWYTTMKHVEGCACESLHRAA